jgi:hypothetical protein
MLEINGINVKTTVKLDERSKKIGQLVDDLRGIHLLCFSKCFYMDQMQSLEAIRDIKKMMERSSRFISLSGWSGITAGLCALAGAWLANKKIVEYYNSSSADDSPGSEQYFLRTRYEHIEIELLVLAIGVFIAAFSLAFLFTYLHSKKSGIGIWGKSARRLTYNTLLPMVAGGFIILRMLQLDLYGLIAPTCLVVYGLGLVNGSKYTLGEVRYLGYGQIVLGIINLWMMGRGLYFWAFGFGILHIIYGAVMWWKYERSPSLQVVG